MATTTAAIKATSEAVSSHGYSHNHKYSLSQSAVNERARLSSATNYLFSYNGTEPTTAEGDPTGHKQQKYCVITQLRLSLWIRRKMCQVVKQKKEVPSVTFWVANEPDEVRYTSKNVGINCSDTDVPITGFIKSSTTMLRQEIVLLFGRWRATGHEHATPQNRSQRQTVMQPHLYDDAFQELNMKRHFF